MSYFRAFCIFLNILNTLCIIPSLHAEQNPLIPRKLLFGNPEKTAAKISPDGTKLAYLAPDKQNVLNVWVRDLQKKRLIGKLQKMIKEE